MKTPMKTYENCYENCAITKIDFRGRSGTHTQTPPTPALAAADQFQASSGFMKPLVLQPGGHGSI